MCQTFQSLKIVNIPRFDPLEHVNDILMLLIVVNYFGETAVCRFVNSSSKRRINRDNLFRCSRKNAK